MSRRFQLSAGECALICIFAVLAALSLVPPRIERVVSIEGPAEVNSDLLGQLVARYGTERSSQGPEELLIRDFFGDERNGTFVDVGAYDPKKWSNTYFLERRLQWTGIAIDALSDFAEAYRLTRPSSRFVVAFVADRNEGNETIHVNPSELAFSSFSQRFTRLFHDKTEARLVPVRSLDSILDDAGVKSVDFLSMDIELGEPAALRGFSIERFKPRLVCIEAHGETRQDILNYFASHGYVIVGKYLPVDRVNLYFMPRP